MSIRQKRTMTEKSLAAHRRNARQSQGPATKGGKKHSRDANISHGFYSQDGGAALEVLGEDPREYQGLAEAVAEKWQPADVYEEQLGTQLVRALWRARRSDRMQEGLALRLAQEAERWRQDNLHARLTKLSFNAACLRSLAQAVGHPDYVTAPNDMEMLKSFQADGVLKDMGTVIMDLLVGLGPEADRGPFSMPGTGALQAAASASAAAPGDAAQAPDPVPEGEEEEDDGREGLRGCLKNILCRQAELLEEQRTACLQELLTGPSPFERAAEFASAYSNMKLLQRVEDSNFRQVWRITALFIKLKGGAPERKKAAQKPLRSAEERAPHRYPNPTSAVSSPQDAEAAPAPPTAVEVPQMAPKTSPMKPLMKPEDSPSPPPAALELDPEPPPPLASTEPAEPGENEGASGKVQSNQYGGEMVSEGE